MSSRAKRPRLDQILNDLDEIGEKKPAALVHRNCSVSESQSGSEATHATSPTQRPPPAAPAARDRLGPRTASNGHDKSTAMRRTASADANSLSKSPVTPSDLGDSVFSSELDRHNRQVEDVVDMALFLAHTYASSASTTALLSLVRHLHTNDAHKVVNAVKRTGQLKPFVASLLTSKQGRPGSRGDVAFLRFFRFIADIVPAEVLCSKPIFERVLRVLDPNRADESVSATAAAPSSVATHWSQRFKAAATAPSTTAVDDAAIAELESALAVLFGSRSASFASDSPVVTCAEILLKLVFNHNLAVDASFGIAARSNSQLHGRDDDGAVLLFRLDGFPSLEAVLQRASSTQDERVKVLQLLDVVTCSSSELAREPSADKCFESVLGTVLPFVLNRAGGATEEFVTALRVAINITSLFPSTAAARPDSVAQVVQPLLSLLKESADLDSAVAECHVYCLCLVVNMLQRGKNVHLCDTVTLDEKFLRFAAAEMRRLHKSDDAESNVTAGYYATLLGMLSTASQESRVRVKHALQAARGESHESQNGWSENPLKFVLAVLQEFVLFQSSAGILTREALVGMHQLLQSLMNANSDIVVEMSAEEEDCA